MSDMYDKEGKLIDLMVWGKLLEDSDYRIINKTRLKGCTVSTVWLGLDHSFGGDRPLIFETMVFIKDFDEDYCERYTTLEEARDGHERAVDRYEDFMPITRRIQRSGHVQS